MTPLLGLDSPPCSRRVACGIEAEELAASAQQSSTAGFAEHLIVGSSSLPTLGTGGTQENQTKYSSPAAGVDLDGAWQTLVRSASMPTGQMLRTLEPRGQLGSQSFLLLPPFEVAEEKPSAKRAKSASSQPAAWMRNAPFVSCSSEIKA